MTKTRTKQIKRQTRRIGRNGKSYPEHRITSANQDQRVIIIAPVGQDAPAMAALLSNEGFETHVCETAQECARQISVGAGLLLLTQEVMQLSRVEFLFQVLQDQPAWSELPLIILTIRGQSMFAEPLDEAKIAAGTVTLLERPINTRTLVHSVEVALRSRRRQYQVRDLVAQLEQLNETLEQRVAKRTTEALERTHQIRVLSTELSQAEERERRRIAQILHEDVQQLLIAALMHIPILSKARDSGERKAVAQEIGNLLERSFHVTRSLSAELAPPILRESGLAAALEWLAAHTSKYYHFQITAETDSSANPKAADVSDFLYRAVRELLLNVVKHGAGKPSRIVMKRMPRRKVAITVSDDGPGFKPGVLSAKRLRTIGFGLNNIRERIRSFGGDFHVKSLAGRGTSVTLIAPCDF